MGNTFTITLKDNASGEKSSIEVTRDWFENAVSSPDDFYKNSVWVFKELFMSLIEK